MNAEGLVYLSVCAISGYEKEISEHMIETDGVSPVTSLSLSRSPDRQSRYPWCDQDEKILRVIVARKSVKVRAGSVCSGRSGLKKV